MIYLDHHATTPIDPRVREAMLPFLDEYFANAASTTHALGMRVSQAVIKAREEIASIIGASSEEIYFTSGATESVNMAIKGLYERESKRLPKLHMITQVTEHKAVLESCKYIEERGGRVTYLEVDEFGKVALEDLKNQICEETILISIMSGNNEIGTLQPIKEIGTIARENDVFFHVDASQSIGKIPLNVQDSNIDLLSFTAHKMYGPKGTGALYIRKESPRVRIEPLIHGGEQENSLRGGTLNVAGIIGFAKACEIAQAELKQNSDKIKRMRDRLWQCFMDNLEGLRLNGHSTDRLPGNLNVSFKNVEAQGI